MVKNKKRIFRRKVTKKKSHKVIKGFVVSNKKTAFKSRVLSTTLMDFTGKPRPTVPVYLERPVVSDTLKIIPVEIRLYDR